MNALQEQIQRDIESAFLSPDEFAEKRTVIYDGKAYEDIPIVLSGPKEINRRQLQTDHVQGLYLVTCTLYCQRDSLGGVRLENGTSLKISSKEGGSFFYKYTVVASSCEMGMLRVELEAIDE